jgi:hypothetical protein
VITLRSRATDPSISARRFSQADDDFVVAVGELKTFELPMDGRLG